MVIFLNGAATSDKTSIIHEMQKLAPFPLLKLGIDNFLDMMPNDYYGWGPKAKEGIQFVREKDENGPITLVYNGEFGRVIFHALPPVIGKISSQDLIVAVDEILSHDYYLAEYTNAFKGHIAYCVAVHCTLDELIRREQKRGSVSVGLGRDQIPKVHGPTRFYDFEVDTSHASSQECGQQILSFMEDHPNPQGFKKLEEAFKI